MRERCRVLFVSASLTAGGSERFTSSMLGVLDRSRFEPMLCLMRPEVTYPVPPDVPVEILHELGKRTIPRSLWRLRRLIARASPDVVVTNLTYTSLFVGEALRWGATKTRWVARFGNPPSREVAGWKDRILDRWLRSVCPRADCFVVNSRGLARDVAEFYPFTANRLRVVYNPTDFAAIDSKAAEPPDRVAEPGVPLVIGVGRLSRQKRPDVLLDAFGRLRRRRQAVLWLCGDGALRDQVAADISRRGLGDSVRLLGFCQNPWALMRQAQVFVMTSDFEGLPNALIEAQALGLPAVLTRCLGAPDEMIDDGRTGYLVPLGDAAAVADRLEELLAAPERAAQMGAAARERVKRTFDPAPLARQWEAILTGSAELTEVGG